MEKLLIVRLGSMGYIVHPLPAAAALQCAFPSVAMSNSGGCGSRILGRSVRAEAGAPSSGRRKILVRWLPRSRPAVTDQLWSGEEDLARMAEQLSVGATQPISCWLGELIAITRRAGRFVGGDSGPMHIAYEPGVTVAILGPTDPARNGPHVATSTMLRSTASATFYSHHDRADEALRSTSVSEVLRATLRIGASDV